MKPIFHLLGGLSILTLCGCLTTASRTDSKMAGGADAADEILFQDVFSCTANSWDPTFPSPTSQISISRETTSDGVMHGPYRVISRDKNGSMVIRADGKLYGQGFIQGAIQLGIFPKNVRVIHYAPGSSGNYETAVFRSLANGTKNLLPLGPSARQEFDEVELNGCFWTGPVSAFDVKSK